MSENRGLYNYGMKHSHTHYSPSHLFFGNPDGNGVYAHVKLQNTGQFLCTPMLKSPVYGLT